MIPIYRGIIEFKLAVLVYKALNRLSANYPAYDCRLTTTTGRRQVRVSNVAACERPRTFVGRTVNAWNVLPASAFDCGSVSGFKRFLVNCDFVAIFMPVTCFNLRDVVSCQSTGLSFLLAVLLNFVYLLLINSYYYQSG